MDRKIKEIKFTNRTFGIEIEFTGFDTNKATQYLRDNNATVPSTSKKLFIKAMSKKLNGSSYDLDTIVQIIDDGSYHRSRNQYNAVNDKKWFLKTDPTVSGMGFEFVSGIKSGLQGLEEVRKVMDAMTYFKSTVNTSCGFHVHHGVNGIRSRQLASAEDRVSLTATHFSNLVTLYNTYSIGLSAMLPNSRTSSNGYGSFNSGYDVSNIQSHARQVERNESDNSSNLRSNTLENINTIGRSVSRQAVYLNQGITIEFRQHSGTTEADKVVNWIALTQAFVNETIRRVDTKSKGKAYAISVPLRTVQNLALMNLMQETNNSRNPKFKALKKFIVRNELKAMFLLKHILKTK